MKLFRRFTILLAACFMVNAVNAQDISESDPAIRKGVLDNGLTYYICKNNYPEHQAGFYIVQKVGSVQEEDSQQGLAHFLEHMAFNGLKHFPEDRMLRYLESNGIKFGNEINAYTSFDQTVYYINGVPTDKRQSLLDSCLLVLADWSGGILLEDEEIDKERGVIKSEKIMRSSASQRMMERFLPRYLSDSKYAYRLPIGKMEVVENFKYNEIREYYKKWYHPTNQGIIIAGDVDPDYMEKKIKEYFGAYTNPENAAPVVYPAIVDNEEAIFITDRDKEQQYSQIEIDFKNEIIPVEMRSTLPGYVTNLLLNIISHIASERYNDLVQKADAPFVYAYASCTSFVTRTKDAFTVEGVAKEGQEYECFKSFYREAMRIQQHGFTGSELNRAKDAILSNAEKTFTNRDKQETSALANRAQANFLNNSPMLSPEKNLELLKQVLPLITLDAINQVVKAYISSTDKNLVCLSLAPEKDGAKYLTEADMRRAVDEVRSETIEAFIDDVKNDPLVENLPKAGKIKAETTDPFTGAKVYTLSNGTKVYALKTDYKADEIVFNALSWGGDSNYPEADVYNLKLCTEAMGNVGLGNFTSSQLSKALTGVHANVYSYIGSREESLSGNCTPKDLEYMMQKIYLAFTNPGNSEEDYQAYIQMANTALKNRNTNPLYAYNDTINYLQYDGNKRAADIHFEDLKYVSFKRIREIYRERFADVNNFTFFFVGNFEYDTLKTMLCKYIATLPKVKRDETYKRDVVHYHKGKQECTFQREMQSPQSRIYNSFTFRTIGEYSLEKDIVADAAAQVLSMVFLKEIREDASLVYNISAHSSINKADGGLASSIFEISCPAKPEYGNLTQKMIDDIFLRIANQGFEQDKLDKVKEYYIKEHQANLKRNSYWLNIMSEKAFYNFDERTNFEQIVNNLTVSKIQNYIKSLLESEGILKVQIQPEGTEQKMKVE